MPSNKSILQTIRKSSSSFIIAELSANHNQDFNIAVKTLEAIKKSGADAVKIQTYTADTITIDSDKEYFKIKQKTIWDGKTLHQLYKEAYTPWEWQPKLKKIAKDLGLFFFSSPFDKTAVDFLEDMDVELYKIASFEITDIPLIKYIAEKKKPIIMSTGIAELKDIELAIQTIYETGNQDVALLKCTSAYPAPLEEINLKTIPNLANTFKTMVGLSDHTLGFSVPVAAVALGAKIIEKHFILNRSLGGADSAFSMEPEEFKIMVDAIRNAEKALGKVNYTLSEKVKQNRTFSRSLFVVENVQKGELFTEKNIKSIRPGYGLHPKYYNQILGKKARIKIERGTPLQWNLID